MQYDTLCVTRSSRWLTPALGRSYSCSATQIKGKLEWSPLYCLSGWSQVIPARTSWAQRLIKILSKFVCHGVLVFLSSSNTLKCSNSPSSPSQIVPARDTLTPTCMHTQHMLSWPKYIQLQQGADYICLPVRSHHYFWGHTYGRTLLFKQQTNWGTLK